MERHLQNSIESVYTWICNGPWETPMIAANGDISVCCGDGRFDLCVGNINKDTFLNIWNNEKITELRKAHIIRTFGKYKKCKNCFRPGVSEFQPKDAIKYLCKTKQFDVLKEYLGILDVVDYLKKNIILTVFEQKDFDYILNDLDNTMEKLSSITLTLKSPLPIKLLEDFISRLKSKYGVEVGINIETDIDFKTLTTFDFLIFNYPLPLNIPEQSTVRISITYENYLSLVSRVQKALSYKPKKIIIKLEFKDIILDKFGFIHPLQDLIISHCKRVINEFNEVQFEVENIPKKYLGDSQNIISPYSYFDHQFNYLVEQKEVENILLLFCPPWGTIFQPYSGLAYLKAYLQKEGIQVRTLDLNIEFYDELRNKGKLPLISDENYFKNWLNYNFYEQFKEELNGFLDFWATKIVESGIPIVGFSTYYLNTESSLELARRIRKLNPSIKIIFGGAEIITNPQVFIDGVQSGVIDIAVKKEGEVRLTRILKFLQNNEELDDIDGIIFRKGDKIVDTELKYEIEDLDSLPTPDFSDYLFSKYMFKGNVCFELPIMTSRGCVGNCTYCNEKYVHGSKFRVRSALAVFNDLKQCNSIYGIKRFFFADSIFNGIPKIVDELCDLIISNKLEISWGGLARFHPMMTPELLKKMRKAGCEFISYGLESGSQKVLDSMSKGYKIATIEQNLKDTHDAGILVKCFIMVGYPSETWEQFNETLAFLERNNQNIDIGLSSITEVMKDCPLGKDPEKYGIKWDKEGHWYSEHNNREIREEKQKIMLKKLEELGLAPGDYGEIKKKPVPALSIEPQPIISKQLSPADLSRLQSIFGFTFTAEMTDICNLRCVYCAQTFSPHRAHEKIPYGMIDPEIFKKAIDEISNPESVFYKSHEVLIHWLGESILHPKFKEMVEYAGEKLRKSGHMLYMDTNGVHLTPEITEVILKNPFKRVHFSIDAATKLTYDNIRRGGDFERVIKNIRYFFERRRQLNQTTPQAMLQFIPVPLIPPEGNKHGIKYADISNAGEIKPFVEYWDSFLKTVNTLDAQYDDAIFIKALNTLADIQAEVNEFYKKSVKDSGIKLIKKKYVTIMAPLRNDWGIPLDKMWEELQ